MIAEQGMSLLKMTSSSPTTTLILTMMGMRMSSYGSET